MEKKHVRYLCEAAEIRRNLCTAYAILYTYSNKDSTFEECRFPKPEFFSVEEFIEKLEGRGWGYDGLMREAREPINGLNTAFRPYREEIPELFGYEGDKRKDLEKAVQNAEKRIRNICSSNKLVHIMFSSPRHGECLSQELYEAGWDWLYPLGQIELEQHHKNKTNNKK